MKKILFYLSIALAIFSLISLCAQDTGLQSGCKIAEHEYTFDCGESNSDKLFFDACLEDLYDDGSNDSEKKKLSSVKISHSNTSFSAQIFIDNTYKKVFPTQFLFLRRIPLFIFISVFRL